MLNYPKNLRIHFSCNIDYESKPIELTETPKYIRALQKTCCDLIDSGTPAKTEITSTLKPLKNGKASNKYHWLGDTQN